MKQWRIPAFGIDNLEIFETAQPVPAAGEVLVKIRAVSLNYRDLLTITGRYNPRMKLPRVPVSDGAGEVVATGPGTSRVKPGDRVAGIFMQGWIGGPPTAAALHGALGGDVDGVLSEYVVLPEEGLVAVPPHLSWEEAATLPCAAVTAWNAVVHAGNIKAGDTVLIQGTGGVSIFALQFAKLLGARVIGTSSSDEKLARCRDLGLDTGVNYRSTPDWANWALEETEGAGVDLVVEVGGAGTLSQSLKAVRAGGTVAQIGILSQVTEPLNIAPILHKLVRLQGMYVGSRADFLEMNRAVALHQLQPVVDKAFSFEEAPAALRHIESGSHFGKLVIRVS